MAVAVLIALALVACRERKPRPEVDAAPPPLTPPEYQVALRGLDPKQPIRVDLVTNRGTIPCTVDAQHAPRAVSLFVGLATGRARWRHPQTGVVSQDPLYVDLPFHRAIPGVMIQSGCVVGDSSGHPGYRIAVESLPHDVDLLKQPGALILARYTPPPNRPDPDPPEPGLVLGSQFGVLLRDMSHLAGQVTVLGRCDNLDLAQTIARAVKQSASKPRLERVHVHGISPQHSPSN